jgi:hypothetical protein
MSVKHVIKTGRMVHKGGSLVPQTQEVILTPIKAIRAHCVDLPAVPVQDGGCPQFVSGVKGCACQKGSKIDVRQKNILTGPRQGDRQKK